jgi:septum formation topological specificity factor MinE
MDQTLNKMYSTLESLQTEVNILQRHMTTNPDAIDINYCKEQLIVLDDHMELIQVGIRLCILNQKNKED